MDSLLLVNPRSGDGSPSADELVADALELGVETHLLSEDDDPAELARSADAGALGIAGGDGSLAAVAAVAVERDLPFVCVPFGTRNHFARDVGLDRDNPLAALAAFGDGEERRVDVGRVGDRLFLNNLSLGIYAGLVHGRERHRRRREVLARARALVRVAQQRHTLHARVDGEPVRARALLVAVNAYDLSLFTLGERDELAGGLLHLYVAAGWLPHTWEERAATSFRVELGRRQVRAAADGEPILLDSPFEVEVLAGALRVLVPRTPERDDVRV